MNRYEVTYKDCGETLTSRHSAYDAAHAEEKFWDSILEWQGDCGGIEILKIKRIKTNPE